MEASTISVALAGLRPIGGELAVLAVADGRAAVRLYDPAPRSAFMGVDGTVVGRMTLLTYRAGQEHFIRFVEMGEVYELAANSGLDDQTAREIEPTGVEAVRV